METMVVERRIGPPEESIPREMVSSAYADDVGKLDMATRAALVDEVGEALRDYRTDDGIAIPQHTHLIRAIA